jgi:hypothetical protein|eukprot:SAG25_NODE_2402_length_1639_cov_2.861039_2_plen_91_part_00
MAHIYYMHYTQIRRCFTCLAKEFPPPALPESPPSVCDTSSSGGGSSIFRCIRLETLRQPALVKTKEASCQHGRIVDPANCNAPRPRIDAG